MEVIIRSASRAVKSTLAMLLIVKDRIAMRRATWPKPLCAPGRCEECAWIMQLV